MSVRIGIGVDMWSARGGLSPEALAWETNIIANGGTIPAATLAIFDQYFFIPATANGNILNQLDRLNIYCGLVGYEIAARTNLIKSAHYVTPVSSPTFDNNGYKSSGTSYLNLNYNPSTQGVKMTSTSIFQFFMKKAPAFATFKRSIGSFGASNTSIDISTGLNESYIRSNYDTLINTNVVTIGYVMLAGRRDGTTRESIINSNVISGTPALGASLINANMFELTSNDSAGSPIGSYDNEYHLCSGHGSSACDYADLITILDNLFTALGI